MEENTPRSVVLRFARVMNDLQSRYNERFRERKLPAKRLHQDYQIEAEKIYAEFLTARSRNCKFGIAEPPTFAGVTEGARIEEVPDAGRMYVTVCTSTGFLDFRFSLCMRYGIWRIDSFKQRYRSEDRSLVYGWCGGSF